jgi:hypothetical protein
MPEEVLTLSSKKFGCGNRESNFCVFGSIREVGITLPGNGECVVGSITGIKTFARVTDCEKSPLRSSCVGIV